jgi:hypothetical protein
MSNNRPPFSLSRLFSRRSWVVLLPLLLILLALVDWYWHPSPWLSSWLGDSAPAWVAGAAAVIIFLAVAPFLLGLRVWGLAYVDELIQGADNRPSTSKIQFLWWTIAVLFVYVALKVRLLQLAADAPLSIPPIIMAAMGASMLTAVGAKAIAVNQAEANRGSPNASPAARTHPNNPASPDAANADNAGNVPQTLDSPTGVNAVSGQNVEKTLPPAGDLRYTVTDDAGRVDLTKVQLLTWTVIAIALFIWRATQMIIYAKPDGLPTSLPGIDAALVVLTGLAQGAYIGRKLVPDTMPWLTGLKNTEENGAPLVIINGKNFGNHQGGNMVTINEIPSAVEVKNWTDTEIKFVKPPGLPAGDKFFVGVVVSGQMSANALPLPN